MDSKADQPLLERMPEFIPSEKDFKVETIELRDAEPATATDNGNMETLQVATEIATEKKSKKIRFTRPKECKPLSVGLNVFDRDEKMINGQVHIMFDDVIAEPDGSHSFEGIWRGNFVIFQYTKMWMYSFFTAIIGWPLSFIYGFLFAMFCALNNFVFTPFFKMFSFFFFWFGRFWGMFFQTFFDPIFESFGRCFSNIRFMRGETNTIGTNTYPKSTGTNGSIPPA